MYRCWDKSKPPVGPFVLDLNSPLAAGLTAWYPFGGSGILTPFGASELSNGVDDTGLALQAPFISAGAGAVTNAVYRGHQGVYVGSSHVSRLGFPKGAPSPPITVAMWVAPSGGTSSGFFWLGDDVGTSPSLGYAIRVLGVNALQWFSNFGVAATAAVTSTGKIVVPYWYLVVACEASATSRWLWVSHVNLVGTNTTAQSSYATTTKTVKLGIYVSSGVPTGALAGWIGETSIWNRELSRAECFLLASQRYILRYPLRSRKWIGFGASAAVNSRYWYDQTVQSRLGS